MNSIPKVTVRPHDGGWIATCRCGFMFWHLRRHVADEQAVAHQRTAATKGRG